MEKTKQAAIIIGASLVVAASVGGALYWFFVARQPTYTLNAKYVTEEPRIDGNGREAAWRDAEPLTIPIKDGEPVTLKAVYTDKKVFFLAGYKDKTKDAVDSVWRYDGGKWEHGPIADELSLFFNIDDSITGFKDKGFAVMNRGLGPNEKIYQTGISAKAPKGRGRTWSGQKQKGDVWEMNVGFTTFYGKAHDMRFSVDPTYSLFPGTGASSSVSASIRFDAFTNGVPFVLNQETALVLGKETNVVPNSDRPAYALKPGLDLKKTPYPVSDDMVKITDYSVFNKGDQVPWVFFVPGKTWGGSFDDIDGQSYWSNGSWTVEMERKLDTGHTDDIVFKTQDDKSYSFGVLVRSNGRIIRSSLPATLRFTPRGG